LQQETDWYQIMKTSNGLFFKQLLTVSMIGTLSACQIFTESRFDQLSYSSRSKQSISQAFIDIEQPGDKLIKIFKNGSQNRVLTTNELSKLVKESNVKFYQLLQFSQLNPITLSKVLFKYIQSNESGKLQPAQIAVSLLSLIENNIEETDRYLEATMLLYPLYTYRISALLVDLDSTLEGAVTSYLIKNKHSPKLIFPREEKLEQILSITSLINSLSVTVFNQASFSSPTVLITNIETQETKTIPLYYEPIQGAFSGSTFNLDSDSKYSILLKTTESSFYKFETRTRPQAPPIDANKIYQLSDFYKGGQLNIKELNISGTADAWAMIDGENIEISANDESAIDIGDSKYIYFKNITISQSGRHGIVSQNAHHLWFDICDISNWGREPKETRGSRAFDSSKAKRPINYDAAFALQNTGVVVIENCDVHSPKSGANSWKFGHPHGPTAMLVSADHPNDDYDGQYVVRNNRFYGSYHRRFNDVIESRNNGRVWGGFVRDSVVHNNYFAHANDDAIEIDGGANNVAVYDNKISNTFVGVSAIPVMMGPTYIFDNNFSNMGDQRGKWFTQVKLGGLFSRPGGVVIFDKVNELSSKQRYSSARFLKNRDFWLENFATEFE